MELAYRLAVSNQPMIEAIRKNVIVLINPVSEPDGRDKVVDWFYRYLKGKTDYENLPEMSPPYWGYYVFHDNNRDTHQKALKLTQAVHAMFYDYHPTAVHDLHESIPLLHTWNGTGPYNVNLDPIAINEWLETSFHEVDAMTALGMPGVWTWGFGESWGLHYLDSVASNHNSLGRGYETFGNHTAETVERTLRPTHRYVDRPVTDREWYRAWPPEKRFVWSLRDNTNYMETGCLSILDWTAKNSKEVLRNFYRKGYNSWQKGVKGKPYAFVIPDGQGDPRRVAQMIGILLGHRIEVARLDAPVTVKEGTFAKGSFVVRLDQPYRNYAVDLLEPQKFPSETPYEPYDDVSWALPVHYGLEAKRIDDEKIVSAALTPVVTAPTVSGRVSGSGPVYLLKDTGQEALLAARFRLSSFQVSIAEKPFKAGGTEYPAGSWIVPAQAGVGPALASAAGELGLDFESVSAEPAVLSHAAPIPRIAVWHLWSDTEATGWLRMALDLEKIPYDYIRDEEIRAGKLRDKYDVILYGDNCRELEEPDAGHRHEVGPDALHEDPGVSEPRRAGRVRRHDRRDRLGRHGEPPGVHQLRRPDADARQRLGAASRGRPRARRPARRRISLHARRRAQGQVRAARAPPRLRVPARDLGLPHGPERVFRAPERPPIRGSPVGAAPHEGRAGFRGRRQGRGQGRTRRTRRALPRTPRWSSRAAASVSRTSRAGRRSWTCRPERAG